MVSERRLTFRLSRLAKNKHETKHNKKQNAKTVNETTRKRNKSKINEKNTCYKQVGFTTAADAMVRKTETTAKQTDEAASPPLSRFGCAIHNGRAGGAV